MCQAKQYSEQLLTIFENIKLSLLETSVEQSKSERTEQDLLHIIENENFNAAEGYKLAKLIKDERINRRNIKIEQETLTKLKKEFTDKYLNNLKSVYGNITKQNDLLLELKENKIYKPRFLKSTNLKVVTSRKSENKTDYIGRSKLKII